MKPGLELATVIAICIALALTSAWPLLAGAACLAVLVIGWRAARSKPQQRIQGFKVFAWAWISVNAFVGLVVLLAWSGGLIPDSLAGHPNAVTTEMIEWSSQPLMIGGLMALFASSGPLTPTEESGLIALRANTLLLVSVAGLWGFDEVRLITAMREWRVSPRLVALIELVLRFRPVMAESFSQMKLAMQARGFRLGWSPRQLHMLAEASALLLLEAIERAERLQLAMRARGWSIDQDAEPFSPDQHSSVRGSE